MSLLMTVFTSLTQDPPVEVEPGTGKGPEWGKAAPIGLLVILLMVIATFFLLRSMVRKINKVPASFDPPTVESMTEPDPRPDHERDIADPSAVVAPEVDAKKPAPPG